MREFEGYLALMSEAVRKARGGNDNTTTTRHPSPGNTGTPPGAGVSLAPGDGSGVRYWIAGADGFDDPDLTF